MLLQDEQIVENPLNSEEKKRQMVLEDLYAVVNKQQKKIQNKDAPSAQSNTVDGVYYNTAAVTKGHAVGVDDEEIAPQIPPYTIEELYTAVVKGSVNHTEETPP